MSSANLQYNTPIDPGTIEDGSGTLFIMDAEQLIDDGWLLGIANTNMECYTVHIMFAGSPAEAHRLLDSTFHDYINDCCLQLGCDARVDYIVDGVIVMSPEYGWDDGSYSQNFRVYCNADTGLIASVLSGLLVSANDDTPLYVVRHDSSPETDYGYDICRTTGPYDFM